jgi:hypothetical protein
VAYDPITSHELPTMANGQQRQGARAQPSILAPGGRSKTKEPVPRASELVSKAGSQVPSKNYIAENRNKAIFELHPPAASDANQANDKHRNYGKVPN